MKKRRNKKKQEETRRNKKKQEKTRSNKKKLLNSVAYYLALDVEATQFGLHPN